MALPSRSRASRDPQPRSPGARGRSARAEDLQYAIDRHSERWHALPHGLDHGVIDHPGPPLRPDDRWARLRAQGQRLSHRAPDLLRGECHREEPVRLRRQLSPRGLHAGDRARPRCRDRRGTNITFAGVKVRNVQGDGFYVTKCGDSTWADTIQIRDGAAYGTTRHGIGIVAARHVRISNMGFKDVGIHVLSIEPDWNAGYAQGATDVVFSGGRSIGWIGRTTEGTTGTQAVYVGTPYGAQGGLEAPVVSGITVAYLRVLDSRYGIWSQVTASGGYQVRNVTFSGNRGAQGAWWTASRGVVTCQDTSGFRVLNNSQPVAAGQGMYMARSMGCSSTSASGNIGSGLVGQATRVAAP